MLKLLFNYYVVLKTCWIVILFQVLGFAALIGMDQGKDILQALCFTETGLLRYHTWFALFGVTWWSWQSWRASRVILHFTSFDFIKFSDRYALQAQVLIPRALGVMPLLIMSYGLVRVTGWSNSLIYLTLALAFWLYLFYYLRKDIIVLFLSRNKWKLLNIPGYVKVKNNAYPAQFIWSKQRRWVLFRVACISLLFGLIIMFPVSVPQFLGSATIVFFALGAWLFVATCLDFAERHFRFPFTFTVIVAVVVFSFFNNNHEIRTTAHTQDTRLSIVSHFDQWYTARAQNSTDTIPIILVACQGGGVRSAYWAAQVLGELQRANPDFDRQTYAYSTVSGGSLGVATYKQLLRQPDTDLTADAHRILSKDFLAPVTSWLVVTDLIQKFIPFPIQSFDRSKALEYSWEEAAKYNGKSMLAGGFLEEFQSDSCIYMFNSTRVENGYRTLLSNVKMDPKVFNMSEDFFDVTHTDIPISTAVSVSSRFPFITPPGLVYDKDGKRWGHLVDGGYVENMGATAMLELYDFIRKMADKKGYKVEFKLLFIKNTKVEYTTKIGGLYEVLAPLNTFSKVWVNSGQYDESNTNLKNLYNGDKAHFITLDRPDDQIIPLGWYLSPQATKRIREQLSRQTAEFKEELTH